MLVEFDRKWTTAKHMYTCWNVFKHWYLGLSNVISKRPLYQQQEDKDACFYKRGNLKLSKCPTEYISTAVIKSRVNTVSGNMCVSMCTYEYVENVYTTMWAKQKQD